MVTGTLPSRYRSIDSFRTALLLLGVVVHAAEAAASDRTSSHLPITETLLMDVVAGSHSFRVTAFFMLAGFLAAPQHAKDAWLSRRVAQLALPLFAVWLTMMLPAFVLNAADDAALWVGIATPGHLWFLITLIPVVILLWHLDRSTLGARAGVWVQANPASFLAAMIFVMIPLGLYPFAVAKVAEQSPILRQIMYALLFIPCYVPLYAVGLYVRRCESLLALVRRSRLLLIAGPALWALTLLTYHYNREFLGMWGDHRGLRALYSVMSWETGLLMGLSVLAVALRFDRSHPAVSWLSERSFSIYLFHYPVIVVLGGTLKGMPMFRTFLVMLLASFLTSLVLHEMMRRSSVLTWLYNGKARSRPTSSSRANFETAFPLRPFEWTRAQRST